MPEKTFIDAFDEQIVELLTTALDNAYETEIERHEPDLGYDGQTFGFNLHKVANFNFRLEAEESDRLSVRYPKGAFQLLLDGKYKIGCYKVGRTAADDITRSFPNNNGAVGDMAPDKQFAFNVKGMAPEAVDLTQVRKVILAHLGNPGEGLCALYVCVPRRYNESGQICEWAFTHELLRRGKVNVPDADLAPDEVLDEVRPRLRLVDPVDVTEQEVKSSPIEIADETFLPNDRPPDEQIEELDMNTKLEVPEQDESE